jgi:transcriptional regulator with XRE-family HTH domain
MTSSHDSYSYEDLARHRRASAEYRHGYAEAERAFLIGRAVRDRRLALGLSQTEVARRAGMTQPALSRLEADGVIPTIPLLEGITSALDADLITEISPTRPDASASANAHLRIAKARAPDRTGPGPHRPRGPEATAPCPLLVSQASHHL